MSEASQSAEKMLARRFLNVPVLPLVEHGHLLFTRRRIPLTIRPGKVARDV
jgi:hypothetical protein